MICLKTIGRETNRLCEEEKACLYKKHVPIVHPFAEWIVENLSRNPNSGRNGTVPVFLVDSEVPRQATVICG